MEPVVAVDENPNYSGHVDVVYRKLQSASQRTAEVRCFCLGLESVLPLYPAGRCCPPHLLAPSENHTKLIKKAGVV